MWRVLILCLWVTPALAVQPGEVLDDPELEQRARAISKELRCLVCQNESIDDSNATLARDLRLWWRETAIKRRWSTSWIAMASLFCCAR